MKFQPVIFYDGECALCHWFVLFVLKRDTQAIFRFAPLQGDTFRSLAIAAEGDTVAVLLSETELLFRSDAVVAVMAKIAGVSPVLAKVLRVIPKVIRDFGYDSVARVRRRFFGTKDTLCPIVPADLQGRFLD